MELSIYSSELEHLNEKLNAARQIFSEASDKEDIKTLKGIISSLEKEIKLAEDNDPKIQAERKRIEQQELREKERLAIEKKNRAKLLKSNARSIIIGSAIIIGVISACIISGNNAERSHTYVSGLRMGIGMMLLFASFLLVPLGKLLSNSLVGPIGGIAIGFGGILMGIGSTVSSDARNGSESAVTFGMMLICIGTIIYIVGYWANKFGKK